MSMGIRLDYYYIKKYILFNSTIQHILNSIKSKHECLLTDMRLETPSLSKVESLPTRPPSGTHTSTATIPQHLKLNLGSSLQNQQVVWLQAMMLAHNLINSLISPWFCPCIKKTKQNTVLWETVTAIMSSIRRTSQSPRDLCTNKLGLLPGVTRSVDW